MGLDFDINKAVELYKKEKKIIKLPPLAEVMEEKKRDFWLCLQYQPQVR
jgi:hypothetical protein